MTAPNCSSRPVHAYTDMLRSLAENSPITIGHVDRAGDVAIAAEGKHVYVMLRRFPNENLDQTLIRLDQAIGRVLDELVYIDEVNPI